MWKLGGAAMLGLAVASSYSNADCASASGKGDDSDANDLVNQLKKKVEALFDAKSFNQMLPKDMQDLQNQINEFIASGKGGQISWGFMMGVCSGLVMKKMGAPISGGVHLCC